MDIVKGKRLSKITKLFFIWDNLDSVGFQGWFKVYMAWHGLHGCIWSMGNSTIFKGESKSLVVLCFLFWILACYMESGLGYYIIAFRDWSYGPKSYLDEGG